jgi:hypothetical protein
VTKGPLGLLQWAAHPVVVDDLGQVGDLVGALDLPVRARGVDEDNVQVQVQQVGDGGEHLGGYLVQRREQEVHPPVSLVVGKPRAALDRDPLGHPPGRGQFATRLQRPLGDQGEDDPLDRLAIQPAALGDPADGRPDPKAFPQAVQHPRPTHPTRVQDLHLNARGHRDGLLRSQEPRDRGHQPGQAIPVNGVGPTEVVDHLRHRGTRARVPLVVREL